MARLVGQEGNVLKFDLGNGQIVDVARPGLSTDLQASFAPPIPPIAPDLSQDLGIPALNFTPGPEVAAAPVAQMPAPEVSQPASSQPPLLSAKVKVPVVGPTGGIDRSVREIKNALDSDTIAQQQVNTAKAQAIGQQINDLNALDQKMIESEKERNKKLDAQAQGLKKAQDAFDQFPFEDPMGGLGNRALAGIAMAFGAMGSSIGGGPNVAQQIIESNMNRSLQLQKANYEKLKDKAAGEQNIYNLLRQQFQDERLADQAFRLNYLEKSRMKMDQLASETSNPVIKAANEKAGAMLGLEAEKLKAQLGIQYAELEAKQNEKSDLTNRYVPGVGVMLTPKDAEDAKKINAISGQIFSNLRELQNLRKEYGAEFMNRDVVKRAKALARDVQLAIKGPEMAQLGVLAGPDLEILEDIIPSDPTSVGFVESQLKQAEDLIRTKVDQFYKSRGAQPTGDILGMKDQVNIAGQPFNKGEAYDWWKSTANSKNPEVQKKREIIGSKLGFSD